MRLPWKTEGALNSQYWLYIFYHSGFLSNLRLPWKTELPWYFHCIKHAFFIIQEFWVTRAFPEKTELPRYFSLYGIYFLHSEFLSNLRLPWKTEGSLNLLYRIYIFIIQEFWVTSAFPKKQSCPGIFHCIEYTLYIQEFWATRAWTEKQSCPGIFRCMEYTFYILNFWATCACREEQRVPWIRCIEYIFYYSGVLSNLRLPWKTELPRNFSLYGIYFLHSEFLSSLRLP